MRRLRQTPALRRLVAETSLSVNDLVAPLFVREGIDEPQPIDSLPGVVQHTQDSLQAEVERLIGLGVPALILFGIPARKDPEGSEAWNPEGVVQVALGNLRRSFGSDIVLMADLCVDEYTDHGHCGVLDASGQPDNDRTLELYRRIAAAQADAGSDVVAPSGMMDGQVAAIRNALDESGHAEIPILAYAAKYLEKVAPSGSNDSGMALAEDKLTGEIEYNELRKEKLKFEIAKEKGQYIHRSKWLAELASKLSASKFATLQVARAKAPDLIVAVGGDLKKESIFLELFAEYIEDAFNELAMVAELKFLVKY
jgi:hypothetical protein